MNIEDIKNAYKFYKDISKIYLTYIKECNKSIDEKWEMYKNFCKVNKHFSENITILNFEEFMKIKGFNYYNHLGYDRGQTVYLIDLVLCVEYRRAETEEYENDEFDVVDLDKLKEEIINTEKTHFVFDW